MWGDGNVIRKYVWYLIVVRSGGDLRFDAGEGV
jgi:hypothetical protein